MGWVSAIGKQVAKSVQDAPVAEAVVKSVQDNAGATALGAGVGAVLPAETTEERLANMAALAGGAITARSLVRSPAQASEASKYIEGPGTEVMGVFGGISARNAPLPKLERAKAMEAAGADPKMVWKETGWLRGEEGAWKFEIDDSKAAMLVDPPKVAWEFDLADMFDHPELYEAYPELKQAQIVFQDMGPVVRDAKGEITRGATGAFDPFFRTVVVNNRLTREEAAEAALHEIQHAVQDTEGFARGGLPEPGKEYMDTPQIEAAFVRLGDLKLKHDRATDPMQKQMIKAQMDTLSAKITEQAQIEHYQRLPGEVEARLVERRRKMSEAERAGTFPKEQYDMAPFQSDPGAEVMQKAEVKQALNDPETDVLDLTEDMQILDLDQFIAFHGTLAKFDEFKTDKIGAGEGAQAFGPGHYFTQSRGIADWYRKRMKTLSPGIRMGKEAFNKANPAHFAMSEYWRFRNKNLYHSVFGGYKPHTSDSAHWRAIEQAVWALEFEIKQIENPMTYPGGVISDYATPDRPVIRDSKELVAFLKAGIQHLRSLDPESSKGIPRPSKPAFRGGGSIYTVAVKLPAEQTIQYDKPFGQQPAAVQKAFREAAEAGHLGKAGAALEKYGDATRMDVLVAALKNMKSPAMDVMRANGIRGVRYLDGMSRGKKNRAGQSYNYVVFNDDDVKVLDRTGFLASQRGGPLDEDFPPARYETPGSPEYEAALAKGLDMSTPARMARAKEMGFDTETVLYHGTDADITAFRTSSGGTFGEGVYFSDAEHASKYADMETGANVIPVYVKGKIATEDDIPIELTQGREIADWAYDNGYAGYRHTYWPGGGTETVIFNPANIRSVNAAFDPDNARSANLLASQRGGPLDDEPLPSGRPQPAPTFYSALGKFVSSNKTAKAPAAQWKGMIQNAPGIKAEEVEWTGVMEWLDLQEGPVTREALAQFVEANGVRVEEVVKQAPILDPQSEFASGPIGQIVRDVLRRGVTDRDDLEMTLANERNFYNGMAKNFPEYYEEKEADATALAEMVVEDLFPSYPRGDGLGGTQFEEHTLPGGQNYKELLLTLPEIRGPETHWNSDENVVAHARFKERAGPNGERVLALEEIQSDWHQKGREDGYEQPVDPVAAEETRVAKEQALQNRTAAAEAVTSFIVEMEKPDLEAFVRRLYASVDPDFAKIDDLVETIYATADLRNVSFQKQEMINRRGALTLTNMVKEGAISEEAKAGATATLDNLAQAALRYREAEQAYINAAYPGGIANAPFKNNAWTELVLKRMIRYAAENGFDAVAWIPGNVQNGRIVDADDNRGDFYDKIVPNAANKLGKKYGARVTQAPMEMPAQAKGTGWEDTGAPRGEIKAGQMQWWSLPITPELRDVAVNEGFAMFSKRGGPLDDTDFTDDLPQEAPQRRNPIGTIAEAGLFAGAAAGAAGAAGVALGWDGIQRTEPEKPPEDMTPAEFERWKAQEIAIMQAEKAAAQEQRGEAPVVYNPLPITPEAEQNMGQTDEMLAIRERRKKEPLVPADQLRKDGTRKERGFLGELQRPDGTIMTEYSIGVEIEGKEIDIPTLVPTLTKEEVDALLVIEDGQRVPKPIVQKAVDHARKRMKEGKSPFWNQAEDGEAK